MKANNIPNFSWSLETGANDLSGNQYKAVKFEADVAKKIAAVNDKVVGFQTDNPTGANQFVRLESNGIAVAEAGAPCISGADVVIMADGTVQVVNETITIAGTVVEGDVYTAVINGVSYAFTALATPTATTVAAGLVALIDAAAALSATNVAGVITVKPAIAVDLVINSLSTDSTAGTIVQSIPAATVVGTALEAAVDGDLISIKLKNM